MRYDHAKKSKKRETMENKINDVIVLNISTENDTLTSPETATEDLLCGDNDQFISCEQLLLLIKRSDRYLIIDIRHKEHYE